MPPRKRQRRLLKTIEEEEVPNKFIDQLSSDDYILDVPSIGLGKILPDYEVIEESVQEAQDIYEEAVLDCYEETQRMLKQQREELKKFVEKSCSEVKIPKTPKRGKNVSTIAKMYETIETRKDRMTKKNLFVNSCVSGDYNVASKPDLGGGLRSKIRKPPDVNMEIHKNNKNIQPVNDRLLLVPKKNRNTTERAVLLAQQDSSLRRADIKKRNLLKEKAERAKREREERLRQVELRRKLKEQEREEKRKEIKGREERSKEFHNIKKPPGTPDGRVFKTPTSTVSRPKIEMKKDTVHETPPSQIEAAQAPTTDDRTIVDKSCERSELTYETPIAPRKRRSGTSPSTDLFSGPLRKNNRLFNFDNVTPEATFNRRTSNTLNKENEEPNQFVKFEAEMKSLEVTDMFSSPLLNSTKINTSLTHVVDYEMTPDKVPLPSTVDDYNIADLSEGDGTDDEDSPRKVIPKWAHMENLRPALKKQHQKLKYEKSLNFISIFGKSREFKVEAIFKGKKYVRASSANWSSPISNPTSGEGIYQKINESIVDNSFFMD